MIYYIVMPIFALLLLIFQVSFLDLLFFGKIGIEVSLIVVIYAGFHLSMARGGSLAFVLGFIFDCITGSITGFHTFFYVAVFIVSRVISAGSIRRVHFSSCCLPLPRPSREGVFLGFIYYFVFSIDSYLKILWIFFIQSIIAGFISPAVFLLLDRMQKVVYVGEPQ